MTQTTAVVILLSICFGYFLCRYKAQLWHYFSLFTANTLKKKAPVGRISVDSNPHLFHSLSTLLNDQPDTAIDSFISAVDVRDDTLDVHFALGSLLRKRGEVSRALAVHQNVLESEGLKKTQRFRAQLELAIDYLSAGVYDRAEVLLKTLTSHHAPDKLLLHNSLRYLVELYECTSDWALAIDTADKLTESKFSSVADEWKHRQAHYSCELALQALRDKNFSRAKHWVKSARRFDSQLARAYVVGAHIEMALNDYSQALVVIRQMPDPSPFISELLIVARTCHQHLQTTDAFENYVLARFSADPQLFYLKYLLDFSDRRTNPSRDKFNLVHEIKRFNHVEHIEDILNAFENITSERVLQKSADFRLLILKLIEKHLEYRCQKCGFSGKQIHWQCPSCKSWSQVVIQTSLGKIVPK